MRVGLVKTLVLITMLAIFSLGALAKEQVGSVAVEEILDSLNIRPIHTSCSPPPFTGRDHYVCRRSPEMRDTPNIVSAAREFGPVIVIRKNVGARPLRMSYSAATSTFSVGNKEARIAISANPVYELLPLETEESWLLCFIQLLTATGNDDSIARAVAYHGGKVLNRWNMIEIGEIDRGDCLELPSLGTNTLHANAVEEMLRGLTSGISISAAPQTTKCYQYSAEEKCIANYRVDLRKVIDRYGLMQARTEPFHGNYAYFKSERVRLWVIFGRVPPDKQRTVVKDGIMLCTVFRGASALDVAPFWLATDGEDWYYGDGQFIGGLARPMLPMQPREDNLPIKGE